MNTKYLINNRWRLVSILGLISLIMIQLIAVFLQSAPWITGDTPTYVELARSISLGSYESLTLQGSLPDALRPPGYPLIISLLLHGLGFSIANVIVMQMTLYALALVLMLKIAGKFNVDFRLVLIIAAAYPFAAIYSSFIAVESWLIIIVAVVALQLCGSRFSWIDAVVCGILTGLAALIRSDMLLLPVIAGLISVIVRRPFDEASVVKSLKGFAVVLAGALVLLPYALWNAQAFGKFTPTPLAAAAGSSLYTASWQEVLPHEDFNALYNGVATERASRAGLIDEVRRLNMQIGAPELTAPFNPSRYPTRDLQIEANLVFGQAAIRRIRSDPSMYLDHLVSNLWYLWNTSQYPENMPKIIRFSLTVSSGLIYLLGLAGIAYTIFVFGLRSRLSGLAILALYPFVVHIPLHTEARYTGASRPLLMLFAALAISLIIKHFFKSNVRMAAR